MRLKFIMILSMSWGCVASCWKALRLSQEHKLPVLSPFVVWELTGGPANPNVLKRSWYYSWAEMKVFQQGAARLLPWLCRGRGRHSKNIPVCNILYQVLLVSILIRSPLDSLVMLLVCVQVEEGRLNSKLMSLTSLRAQGVWVLACSVTRANSLLKPVQACSLMPWATLMSQQWIKCSEIQNLVLCKSGQLYTYCNEIICNKNAW